MPNLPKDLEELTRPSPRAPNLRACPVCGQHFDADDFEQIYHHDDQPHEPLTSERP